MPRWQDGPSTVSSPTRRTCLRWSRSTSFGTGARTESRSPGASSAAFQRTWRGVARVIALACSPIGGRREPSSGFGGSWETRRSSSTSSCSPTRASSRPSTTSNWPWRAGPRWRRSSGGTRPSAGWKWSAWSTPPSSSEGMTVPGRRTLPGGRPGPSTGPREVEWLDRWESAAVHPDLQHRLMEARPGVAAGCRMRLSHAPAQGEWVVEDCVLTTTWPFPVEAKCPPCWPAASSRFRSSRSPSADGVGLECHVGPPAA